MQVKPSKVIVVSDREPGLPYSKGMQASDIMVSGLSPFRAYQVAEEVEQRLLAEGVTTVGPQEVHELTARVIADLAGERYATNFLRWKQVDDLDVPIVVLIGGATGVGKSTLATQLAVRLGIVRVVGTDSVREVMRAMLTRGLMPSLYTSSFSAGDALREPVRSADKVIVGFREQAAAVAVGVDALLSRAAIEGSSAVIEGAHVVPGFFDVEPYEDRMLAIPIVIAVEDEDVHRSHFTMRADAGARGAARYLEAFPNIRRVQKYIKSQALSHNVPVIPNYSLDQALAGVIDLVIEAAAARLSRTAGGGGRTARAEAAAQGAHSE